MRNRRAANRYGSPRRARRGSALILSLLVIVVLSVTVAGTLSMMLSERKSLGDFEASVDAYDLARSAYDEFIADPTGALAGFAPPTWVGPDSVYFTFPTGYAYVSVQRVMPAAGTTPATYLVRSRAVRTAFRSGNTPSAERIFAQYAQWSTGSLGTLSAWTSLSGLHKNGGSGTISGVDACGATPSVAGVAVPTVPGYTQNGGSTVPNGSPPILDMGTQANADSMVKIDWAGIVNGAALTPDITIPGGSWPGFSNASYWPVIYVDQPGAFSVPGAGRGVLIVRNDLTISGSNMWSGVILVGGTLTSNGNNTVSGAVVSGLNVLLGQAVPVNAVGNGNKTFEYNSCNITSATARFGGLIPLRNTSVDNWPSY